ncbi:MAG: transposase [Pedococcus sp.]
MGTIVASTIIGHTGDVTRFPTRGHYASFNGTPPRSTSAAATTTGTGSTAKATAASSQPSTSWP